MADVIDLAEVPTVVEEGPVKQARGDVAESGMAADDLVPFHTISDGAGRRSSDEVIVVEGVGTANLDAATAGHLIKAAVAESVGTTVAPERGPRRPAPDGSAPP